MKIKEIMTKDVICCSPDDPVKHVSQLLRENKISGIPVVHDDKVVGIITGKDILKLLEVPEKNTMLWLPSPFEVIEVPIRELINWEEAKHALDDVGIKKASEIMSQPVITASPENSLEAVASKMVKHNVNRIPIVEDGHLVGIITRQNVIAGLSLSDNGNSMNEE
ncbi:MAG: CBS domain-containing protein [Candidatus Methanomarinus sp.]|uniref:CBS domain-containing protein n=1 Tax=Candidatus Methanomarinus sp. TaxID=3386244 RepID=A0AC61SBZ7_9EURY|nr:MAG: CBS domain-containing protein [ANME-2 cluster archaeon]